MVADGKKDNKTVVAGAVGFIGLYYLATMVSLDKVRPMLGLGQYFDFLSTMCLSMGLVFQLPIVMIFLSRIGMLG